MHSTFLVLPWRKEATPRKPDRKHFEPKNTTLAAHGVSVRSALVWFAFITAAFALPAAAVRVPEGRLFRCQDACLTSVLPKWPSHQIKKIKKKGLPPQTALKAKARMSNPGL